MKKLKGVSAFFLLAVAVGCGRAGVEAPKEGESASESPGLAVRAERAQQRAMAESVREWGRCEALLDRLASLSPLVEGQVSRILSKQGDAVKKGQAIVELDPTLARDNLAEKTAARDGAYAALRLLESLPRTEERKNFELAIEQAKAGVEKAQAAADRLRPLRERNEISQQQMFEADLAVTLARLQQQTAESQLKVALLGPRPEAVEEARTKIASADAAVASAKAQLDFHTIRAPLDGVLDSLSCQPGQTVAVGTSLGTVVDSSQVYVLVWFPVPDARRVNVGQTARIETGPAESAKLPTKSAAEAGSSGKPGDATLTGKVVFVGQVVDPQSGNLPVRVLVENRAGRLTVGQTVSVQIAVREQAGLLAVPVAAIHDLGEGPVLNVIREGKSVALKPRLGMRDDGWIEILGTDLRAGEQVIVEGGYNLPEDTPVAPQGAKEAEKEALAKPRTGEAQ
ncbi:MAG: efflux RND transporter periplasmic adaptor subunit [Pirellulales bacterium]